MELMSFRQKDNILLIKDVHRYDIFEEVVAEMLDIDNNQFVNYDKLPSEFTTPDEWPTRTNLCCAYDGENFETTPVFIPINIKQDGVMTPVGCFCDYPCAIAFIKKAMDYDDEKIDELLKNVCKLYRTLTLNKVEYILPADSVLLIDKYGGDMTINEWRTKQRKHIMNNLPI